MLVAGASGYVLKDTDGDEILARDPPGGHRGRRHLPRGHAHGDRGAHRGPRARTAAHPPARDRAGGAARTGRPAPRADLAARSRAPHAGHRDPGHGADAAEGHRPRGGTRRDPRTASSTGPNGLARLVHRFEAAVEAGLTEWADVVQVAREVAADARPGRASRPRRDPRWRASTAPRLAGSSRSSSRTPSRSHPQSAGARPRHDRHGGSRRSG